MEDKNIAIIPARGGSKRLPQKNILPLDQKPLIEYTLDFAKANKAIIDTVVVSTDDSHIKSLAESNGIKVIDRPIELSGDLVPTADVLKHVIEVTNKKFDNVILLQVTNPLRPEQLLVEAYKAYTSGTYDSLMTVTRNHQKFGKINHNKFKPYNYQFGQRSQDLEPLYFENGLLYISKTDIVIKNQILGNNNYPFIVNHPFAEVDIDTQDDLDFAEYILKKHLKNGK